MSIEFRSVGFDTTGTYAPPIEDDTSYRRAKERQPNGSRSGIPHGTLNHEEMRKKIKIILNLPNYGIASGLKKILSPNELKHFEFFRTCLFLYDTMVKDKVFSSEELWFRCLKEGSAFAKFIKKSRAQSLQYLESLEEEPMTEFVHSEYRGYDSIMHERYLIHWEDQNIADFTYSLPDPQTDFPEDEYRQIVINYLHKHHLLSYEEDDSIPIIDKNIGKVSSLNRGTETTLLKNTWGLSELGPWAATRKILNIEPGNIRDTAVPDISTLNHLKCIHKHAAVINRRLPEIADVPIHLMQRRVQKMKSKSSLYMHLDFKKFGLSTDRRVGNTVLEVIGKEHLKIPNQVYLNIGEEVIISQRGGGALGWSDTIFAIGVSAVLDNFRKENNLDRHMSWLSFRDDVEIGFCGLTEEDALLVRDMICAELERFGLILSYKKIYVSRRFIFLEDYHHLADDELNMEKRQLTIKQYAKSLCTTYEWQAKFEFSEAYTKYQNTELTELCINAWPRDHTDPYRPYEVGGWMKKFDPFSGLNAALEDASVEEITFFLKMGKYKRPDVMPKWEDIKWIHLEKSKEKLIENAYYKHVEMTDLELDEPRKLSYDEESAYRMYNLPAEESEEDDIPPAVPARPPVEPTGPGPPR
jgi:hypothetical protein